MNCPTCDSPDLASHIGGNVADLRCLRCGSEWTALILGNRMIPLPGRRMDAPVRANDTSEIATAATTTGGGPRLVRDISRGLDSDVI